MFLDKIFRQQSKERRRTGKAVIHFPYESKRNGKTYNSVLLVKERSDEKYALPGGTFEKGKDKDTLDAAIREVQEELRLSLKRGEGKYLFSFQGPTTDHDIYLFENGDGNMILDEKELMGIGFLNAGRHNQIPLHLLQGHTNHFLEKYMKVCPGLEWDPRKNNKIKIPGYYFVGNKKINIIDWDSQRKNF